MVSGKTLVVTRGLTARIAAPLLLALAGCVGASAAPQGGAAVITPAAQLEQLFRDDARNGALLDPIGGLSRGQDVPADRLAMLFTDELLRRERAASAEALARLATIDRAALSPEQQISYDVFREMKEQERAFLLPENAALVEVRPFNHFYGLHVDYPSYASGEAGTPLTTVANYEHNLERNRAFARVLDNAVARFRKGMKSGVVETRLTVTNMLGQIDALLAQPVEQSPFYAPILAMPDEFSPADRDRLAKEYRRAIESEVYPAYRRLRGFLAQDYLPVARERVGLSEMKDGARLYRLLVRANTTLDLDPEQVHRLGLAEVARIQGEMDKVKVRMGFTGPLPAFFEHLRSDPKYHPETADDLRLGFEAAGRKVDALAPKFFRHLPKTPLLIQPYPAFREKYEAGGSYSEGSADGKRPGIFFFNTYDLPSRFLTGINTLYLHEGAPGHHFQISLAQENAALPDFQRFGGNTAYLEGWALYAETLGFEMGLYDDPWQHWGTLDDEMLRAMRLVVDTGLHTKGWSREQAIDYMLANSGMGRSDATAEVERYIANPAQALAYKIGALTIQRLRRKAEVELGARFDIRDFHDQVLGSGALPLPVLEAKIDRWIARTGI
ncbi:MAG TPA: DUF885 domain-containing protein [Legionella sp.]|nr:DUF885 domain-containing protein [Legionella sp.]